jgi:hypothetical protein
MPWRTCKKYADNAMRLGGMINVTKELSRFGEDLNLRFSRPASAGGSISGSQRRGEYTRFRCCVLVFSNQVLHHQHSARRLPLRAPAVFTLMLGSAIPSFPLTPRFGNGVPTLPNPILAGVPEESKNWKPRFA